MSLEETNLTLEFFMQKQIHSCPYVQVLWSCVSCVFRVVQIGKALQDQQWLFESLMVQVEERRSAVENNAKQIEDRSV